MLSKFADALEGFLTVLLYLVLIAMIFSILAQVIGRYMFDHTPAWTEEVARMSIAWITMIGSAVVIRRSGHISVTVVLESLPPRLARVICLVRDVLILVMCGGLAWYGYGFAVIGGRRLSPALEISMFYPFLAIPVGAVLIGVLMACRLAEGEDRNRRPEPLQ